MLEVVVFGIVVVVAQIVAGFAMLKLFTSKAFLKRYTKKYMNLIAELEEDMAEEMEL